MSTRAHFPRTLRRAALGPVAVLSVALAAAAATPGSAAAENLVLSGPPPMLNENALTLHLVSGDGLGGSFSGRGFALGYGYMLQGPLWLDLQMTWRASACSLLRSCSERAGDSAELLAGLAWRFRTDIPLVPYVRGAMGLVFLYPDHFKNAMGVMVRAGGGLRYFVYDWLGFGAELGLSIGHANFAEDYPGDDVYRVVDLGAGVEFQFR
jgi:hypothetical protein